MVLTFSFLMQLMINRVVFCKGSAPGAVGFV